MDAIVGVDGQRYQLVFTADAAVVPGKPRRIRDLCEKALADGRPVDPAEILAILDEE